MDAMHMRHSPEHWRLFIDASKKSLMPHSHCRRSRAEPNRFDLENKPTLWNGNIHTARRTE